MGCNKFSQSTNQTEVKTDRFKPGRIKIGTDLDLIARKNQIYFYLQWNLLRVITMVQSQNDKTQQNDNNSLIISLPFKL
jgi:hypothetical protein